MAQYTYHLFDAEARMVRSEIAAHRDILDALERMRTLLDEHAAIAMVQLWQHENFIGHINRTEGRLILKRQSDPAGDLAAARYAKAYHRRRRHCVGDAAGRGCADPDRHLADRDLHQ